MIYNKLNNKVPILILKFNVNTQIKMAYIQIIQITKNNTYVLYMNNVKINQLILFDYYIKPTNLCIQIMRIIRFLND